MMTNAIPQAFWIRYTIYIIPSWQSKHTLKIWFSGFVVAVGRSMIEYLDICLVDNEEYFGYDKPDNNISKRNEN